MQAHGIDRAFLVTLCHHLNNTEMVAHSATPPTTAWRLVERLHKRRARQQLRKQLGQNWIAAKVRNEQVKFAKQTNEPVLVNSRFFLNGAMSAQTSDVVRGAVARRVPHDLAFDQPTCRVNCACLRQ